MLQLKSGLTHITDCWAFPVKRHGWEHACPADAEEETPPCSPKPKGKSATVTLFFDANLCHDLISGKAVTGILHMFNQRPVE